MGKRVRQASVFPSLLLTQQAIHVACFILQGFNAVLAEEERRRLGWVRFHSDDDDDAADGVRGRVGLTESI